MKIVYVDSAHLDLSYLLLPLEVCCFAGCVPVALDHHGEARVSRNGLSVEASLGQHDVTRFEQLRIYHKWLDFRLR